VSWSETDVLVELVSIGTMSDLLRGIGNDAEMVLG
jgi:hypothetical protein